LIELLVVIAIIGILASIVLASLTTARQKSRDARRLADMKSVQTALELYYSTNGNTYPPRNTWANLTADLNAGYMSGVPNDPTFAGLTTNYTYQATRGDTAPTACAVVPCGGYLMRAQTEYIGYLTADVTGVGNVPTAACTSAGGPPYNYCVKI